jgi:hypothetical protein
VILREKVQEFLSRENISTIISSRQKSEELTNLYAEVTGLILNCFGCGDKMDVALSDLKNFVGKDLRKPEKHQYHNRMYKLKKNALISVFMEGKTRHFNWENITDEVAALYLKQTPMGIAHFESVPAQKVDQKEETASESLVKSITPEVNPEPTDAKVLANKTVVSKRGRKKK